MPSCRFALALLLVLCLACEAAVVLTDAEGAVWTQYTDDETGMPYYHDAKGGRTQWTLPTAAAPAAEPAAAEAEADPEAAEQAVIDTIFGTAAAAADDAAAAAAEPAAIDAVFGTAPAAAGAEPIAKQQQPVYGAARTLSTPTRNNPNTAENPAASASEWSVLWDIAQKAQAAEAAFVPKGDGQVLANPEAAESADYAARWAGDPGMLGKHKGAAELVRKLRAEYEHSASFGLNEGGDAAESFAHNTGSGTDAQLLAANVRKLKSQLNSRAPEQRRILWQCKGQCREPVDLDTLDARADPAGKLWQQRLDTPFTTLPGIKACALYKGLLRPPLAFEQMFSDNGGVERERVRVEEALELRPNDFTLWESLGHVWRQYGYVDRTVDCYLKAISLGPPKRSSLLINLSGVLDQMNFVDDALAVVNVLFDGCDVVHRDCESNLAVAYMMTAQLNLRKRDYVAVEECLNLLFTLQPNFRPAVAGMRIDFLVMKEQVMLAALPGTGTLKAASSALHPVLPGLDLVGVPIADPTDVLNRHPWLALEWLWHMPSHVLGKDAPAAQAAHEAWKSTLVRHPRLLVVLRKILNSLPVVAAGFLTRLCFDAKRFLFVPTSLALLKADLGLDAVLRLAGGGGGSVPAGGGGAADGGADAGGIPGAAGSSRARWRMMVPLFPLFIVGVGMSMYAEYYLIDCAAMGLVGNLLCPIRIKGPVVREPFLGGGKDMAGGGGGSDGPEPGRGGGGSGDRPMKVRRRQMA